MDTLSALLHLQYEKNSPVRSVLYHQSYWYDGTGVTSLAQKTWPGWTRQGTGACVSAGIECRSPRRNHRILCKARHGRLKNVQ
jgi:hypothetical protein